VSNAIAPAITACKRKPDKPPPEDGAPDAGNACLGLGAGSILPVVAGGFCLLFAMKDKNRVSSWNIKEPNQL
jgi:hypothetical protein